MYSRVCSYTNKSVRGIRGASAVQLNRIIEIPNEQGISETGRERGRNIWIGASEHFRAKFSLRALRARICLFSSALACATGLSHRLTYAAHAVAPGQPTPTAHSPLRSIYIPAAPRRAAPCAGERNIWNICEHAWNICLSREHFERNFYYTVEL